MIETISTIVSIEKEAIINLQFPLKDVLSGRDPIVERRSDIEKATRLGNMFKSKVKIVFEDSEGKKIVETTIWGTDEKNVLLKNGITIPIHRVHCLIM